MKTVKVAILTLFAALMLSACGGGSPEAVAQKFQSAIMEGDFEKAAQYASSSTAPLLKSMATMIPADQLKELKDEAKGTKVKVGEVEVEGDTATVTLEMTSADGEVDSMDYHLVKEDGSWKVVFEK